MRKKVKYNTGGPVPGDTSLARNLLDQFGTQAVGALEQNANVVNTQEFDKMGAAVNKTKQVANLMKQAAGKKGAEALAKFNTTAVGGKLAEVAGSKLGTFLSSGAGAATTAGLGLLGKKIQQWDQKDGNYSKAGAMGGGALQGAAIGSALGPLGMAAGAGIGAVVGAAQKEKFDAQAKYQEVVDFANEGAAEASQRLAKRAILNTFPIEGMKEQVYAHGGQHDPPATRQDSLDVYNNAVALEQALRSQGYDIAYDSFPNTGKYGNATEEQRQDYATRVQAFYNDSFGDELFKKEYDEYIKSGEWKEYYDTAPTYAEWQGRSKTVERLDKNRVKTREMSANSINMDLPVQLLDKRIKPQGFVVAQKTIDEFNPNEYNFVTGYDRDLTPHKDNSLWDANEFLTNTGDTIVGVDQEGAQQHLDMKKRWGDVPEDTEIVRPIYPPLTDLVGFPYYDPLMVKPYDMLTDEEKKQRAKKERKTITKVLASEAGPGYSEERANEPQGRVLDISEYTDEQRAAYDKYQYENFPFSDFDIHEFVAKNYPDWKPAPLVPKPDSAPEPLPHRLPQSPTPELVTSKAKRTGPKLVGEDEYYIDPMRARSAAGFRGGYQDGKYATGVRRTYENPDGTRFTRTEPYDAEHIEINRQNALDPERFKASASFAHGGEHDPTKDITVASDNTRVSIPIVQAIERAGGFDEYQAELDAAQANNELNEFLVQEAARLDQGEIRPAGRGAPPNAMAFMPPGLQYNQKAAGKYIEENPYSNPVSLTALGAHTALSMPATATSLTTGPLKNAYKLNPFATKLNNPNAYYRVVGRGALDDALQSGMVRSRPTVNARGMDILDAVRPGSGARTTPFPSFAKGKPIMHFGKGEKPIIFENTGLFAARGQANPVTGNIIKSKHGAYRPIDPTTGRTLGEVPVQGIFEATPHWLKGYSRIKKHGGNTDEFDYLAEGGEMIQHAPGDLPKTDNNGSVTPITATLARINGDKHSAPSGGVAMKGNESARIYSDQLHVSDELLAQLSRL